MIDQRTVNRDYPVPHPDNMLDEDVTRIKDSFEKIDIDVNDLYGTTTQSIEDAQSGAYWFGSSTGTGMAYEINLNPAPTALNMGMFIYMKAHSKNLGSATVKVNSLDPKIIKKIDGSDLKQGDIPENGIVTLVYDGINFQLVSSAMDKEQTGLNTSNIMRAFEEIQENHGGALLMEAGWSDSFSNPDEQGADEASSSGYQHDLSNTLYKGTDPGIGLNSDKNYDTESNFIQQVWTNSNQVTSQAVVADGSIILDQDTASIGEFINWWRSGEIYQAQSLTPSAGKFHSFKVNLRSVGSPTHVLVGKIYAESGDQKTGPALYTSGNYNASNLTGTFQEVEFVFTGFTPDGATKYVFSVEGDDVGDASNYIQIEGVGNGAFAGGVNSYDGVLSIRDLQMKTFFIPNSAATISSGIWPSNCANGRISFDSGSTWHDISSRDSDTQLTLTTAATNGTFDYIIRMSEFDSSEVKLNSGGSSNGLDNYTKLLLHFDGNFTDSSDSNHSVTAVASTTTSSSESKFGGSSVYMNGNGSSYGVQVDGNHPDFQFGTEDFTIDFWFRLNDTGRHWFFTHSISGGSQYSYIEYGDNSSNNWRFGIFDGSTTIVHDNPVSLNANQWYHFAETRSGNSLRMFIDGTQMGNTETYTGTFNGGPGQILSVGDQWSVGYRGYIDEFRISKGIARWTSNFTPPNSTYSGAPSPVLEYVSICDSESHKTNTSGWLDIISGSSTEDLNSQQAYYWLGFDPASNFGSGTEIKIFKNTDSEPVGTSSSYVPDGYDADNRTLVDLYYSVGNSQTVSQIGMKVISDSPIDVTIMIFNEDSITQYDILYSEAGFTHTGNGELEWFTLSTPYVTPASGTIRVGYHIGAGSSLRYYQNEPVTMPYLFGAAPTGNDVIFLNGGGQIMTSYKHHGATPSVWRAIAKNDGAWKYNNDATDTAAEDWVPSTVGDMLHAVSQAISSQSSNRMTRGNLASITDSEWEGTGGWSTSVDSIIRGVTLYSNSSTQSPSVFQYHLNYDSEREAMDLRSKAYDPGFTPSESYVWSRIEHTDSDGPGTFYVSRNGGTEWTVAPITQQGSPLSGDIRIYRGTVYINGQASGQDLRCRYETEIGKDQFLHSWGLQAKP
jgi:hypothetical protein